MLNTSEQTGLPCTAGSHLLRVSNTFVLLGLVVQTVALCRVEQSETATAYALMRVAVWVVALVAAMIVLALRPSPGCVKVPVPTDGAALATRLIFAAGIPACLVFLTCMAAAYISNPFGMVVEDAVLFGGLLLIALGLSAKLFWTGNTAALPAKEKSL